MYSSNPNQSVHQTLVTLDAQIRTKVDQTQGWVTKHYGGDHHALFLLNAEVWVDFPRAAQAVGGLAMAKILADTYPPDGQGYPLPEFIGAEFNTKAIASGMLKPYFGFVAPKSLTAEAVYAQPELLAGHLRDLQPMAVSARVVAAEDGSQELGRSAKVRGHGAAGFRAGALILQSYRDWLLADQSPVTRAEVRAADEHWSENSRLISSSAATQQEYFGRLGLVPTRFLPAYVVGGKLEPFIVGERRRSDSWRERARQFTIYTPSGPHVPFLQALGQYQTGAQLPLEVFDTDQRQGYDYCAEPEVHGSTVYAKVETGPQCSKSRHSLAETLVELDELAPMVMVRVPAYTIEGAKTQKTLMGYGFVVCGFEPAHDAPHERGNGVKVVPPMVCLARPGSAVRDGRVVMAPLLLPDTGDVYGNALTQEFRRIDTAFRAAIVGP